MDFPPAQHLEQALPQRAMGRLELAFKHEAGATRLEKFFQEGCLKARLPRPEGDALEAVMMNISGGIAGGDVLKTRITAPACTCAVVASAAAERIYRALEAPARITTRLAAGAGASLHYLPQETLLFDGFALHRQLEIDLSATAEFIGVETLVFGRRAMGENLRTGELRDEILLKREGKTVLRDITRLSGDITARLARPAIGGGAGAVAALIVAGPQAPALLAPLRAALAGAQAGASLVHPQIIFGRVLAPDGQTLRQSIVAALKNLRGGRALPKVWQG